MHDEITSMDISNKMMGMTTTLLLTKPLAMQKYNPAAGGHQSYRSHLTSASSDISNEEQPNDECEDEDDDSRASSTVGNCDDVNGHIVLKEKAKLASDDINLPSPPSSNGSPYNGDGITPESFISHTGQKCANAVNTNEHQPHHQHHHHHLSAHQPEQDIQMETWEESINALADECNEISDEPSASEAATTSQISQESSDVESVLECLVDAVVNELPSICVHESRWESVEINMEGETILPNGVRIYQGIADVPFSRADHSRPPVFTNQLSFLKLMLTKHICRLKTALPFLQPVDSALLKIPHYYKIIRQPMDLTTIRNRINFLWYRSATECIGDIRLMFNNCYYFNAPTDKVYQTGKRLEETLNEKLKDMPQPEVEIACPAKPSMEEYNKIIEKRYAKKRNSSVSSESFDASVSASGSMVGGGGGGGYSTPATSLSLLPPIKVTTRSERGVMVRKPSKDLPAPISTPQAKPSYKKVSLNGSMKFCLELVRELFHKKHADYTWPFWEPVNTNDYPDYLNIIKKPMDLSKIRMNIETGKYVTVDEFADDVRLMISNCLRYNKQDSPIITQARKLRETFEYRYALIPEEFLTERLKLSTTPSMNSGNVTPLTASLARHTSLDAQAFTFFTPATIAVESSKSKKRKLKDKESKSSGKRHSHDGGSLEMANGSESAELRMKFLEKQVELLTNALTMSPLATLIQQRQPALNGGEPVRRGRKPGSKNVSKGSRKSNAPAQGKAQKRRHLTSDEDSSDEETGPMMQPFDPKSVSDLQKLKFDLENLKAKDLQIVLRILQARERSVNTDAESNVEIDFEKLKPKTLIDLRNFVNSVTLNNSRKASSPSNSSSTAAAGSSSMLPASTSKRTSASARGSTTDCDTTIPAWSRTESRTSNVQLSEESSSDSEVDE